jgi:flavorubredoxin
VEKVEGIVELVPGRLYRLGGSVPASPRISWLPAGRTGYEPINAYLLREGSSAVLVDSGVRAHGDVLLSQLATLLEPGSELSLFFTRNELDCIGNIDRLADAYEVGSIYAGGRANPFESFDTDAFGDRIGQLAHMVQLDDEHGMELSTERSLYPVRTTFRLLATNWAYDEGTRTLFTSDTFGHIGAATAAQEPICRTTDAVVAVDEIGQSILAKMNYIATADVSGIRRDLAALLERFPVDIIAPSHGCVLVGADVVRAQHALVDAALHEVGGSG